MTGMPLAVAWRVVERRGVDMSDIFGIVTASERFKPALPPRRACYAPIGSSAAPRRRRAASMAASTIGGRSVPETQSYLLTTSGPALTSFDAYAQQGGYTAFARR